MTTVRNTETGATQSYSIGPRRAVMAAYAQSKGDYQTWQYEDRYGHLVKEHQNGYSLGDYQADKE